MRILGATGVNPVGNNTTGDPAQDNGGLRWASSRATWPGGPTGVIQVHQGGIDYKPLIEINPVKGPFKVTVKYASSNDTDPGRFAVILIDDVDVTTLPFVDHDDDPGTPDVMDPAQPGVVTGSSTLTAVETTLDYEYEGTDVVKIGIAQRGGLRIAQITLESLAPPPLLRFTNFNSLATTLSVTGTRNVSPTGVLTQTGTGQQASGASQFSFVYLNAPVTEEFTMLVKVDSATFTDNGNSGRLGLTAMRASAVTKNASTGALTINSTWPVDQGGAALTGSNNGFVGVGIRPDGTSNPLNWGTWRQTTGWGAQNDGKATVPSAGPGAVTTNGSFWLKIQRRGNQIYGSLTTSTRINEAEEVVDDDAAVLEATSATIATVFTKEANQSTGNFTITTGEGLYVGFHVGNADRADLASATVSKMYFKAGAGMGAATVLPSQLDEIDLATKFTAP